MNEKLKIIIYVGVIIFSFFISMLCIRSKRNGIHNNRKRTDTAGTEQSNADRTNGRIENRLDTVESITGANSKIFNEVRKRKKDT